MSALFKRRVGTWLAVPGLAVALSLPAASCPVATHDGEMDASALTFENFSPVGSVRASDVDTRQQRALAASECVDGMAGVYPCSNVDLMSFLPLSDIGGGGGNDIWGWTDPDTGNEYAIMGRTNGTSFVDITDAENPIYLGNLPTHTSSSSWRDLKVHANHAYVVSEASGHGMQVFDLTQLRDVSNPPQTFSSTTHYGNFGNAHNIVINEETAFAYAVGTSTCSGGLHMIDLSNPAAPAFAGCYSDDGYTHDAQCVVFQGPSHRFHHGSELCFNSNEDTLTIVDVTNKSAPELLARLPYPNRGYTHQGWLTEDHKYFILDDELDERNQGHNTRTRVFDVSDPAAPVLVGLYDSTAAAIDHNLYIKGEYAFQANYRAGLRILEIVDPVTANLQEEAFFDIYPSSDSAQFNGAWSVYPYFESGNVIVSGIEQGLFVLRPTSLTPSFDATPVTSRLQVCGVGSTSTSLEVREFGGFTGTVNFTVSGAPVGTSATLNPPSLVPPAATTLFVDVTTPQVGQFLLNVEGTSGDQSNSAVVNLDVSLNNPAAAVAQLPLDGDVNVSSNQTLFWSAVDNAYTYDIEVASDAGFSNIVASASDLTASSYALSALPDGMTLYWRVTSRNACGSVTSSVFSFTTAVASCTVYTSDDVPVSISATDANTVTSSLITDAEGQIIDAKVVDLFGTHTYLGDLVFQLQGPINANHSGRGNTRHSERALVRLIDGVCGSQDDFDVNLDDGAPAGDLPCPYNDGGTYRPLNELSALDGSPGTGDWTLIVEDTFNEDGGSLDGWGVEICTTPEPASLDTDGDGVPDDLDNCTLVANPDQRDTHGDGYGNICDPDLDNNGTVNVVDLGLLRSAFFATGAGLDEDFNGDGVVNIADLGILRSFFFGPPGPSGVAIE